jgi:hypothetical protein
MPPYDAKCHKDAIDFWRLRQKSAVDALTTQDGEPLTDLQKTGILTNIIRAMSSDGADHLETAGKRVHPAYISNKINRHPQREWTRSLLYGLCTLLYLLHAHPK